MSLDLPTSAQQVVSRSKADVQRELAQSNPFLKNSWLGAIVTAAANRIYDFYLQLKAALKQSFPDTATDDYLERWGAIWGKSRLAASQAVGNVAATGAGGTIPINTVLTISGKTYKTTQAKVIAATPSLIFSITRVGQVATATTVNNHNLANNCKVTILGAVQAEYNVANSEIIVTGLKTFTFTVAGSPATPATGVINASCEFASIPVISDDFGADTNQSAGAQLRLQSPLVNVDNIMTVDFGTIGGGSDEESDEDFRARILDRIQNPVAQFNVASIVDKAKEVPGVTRVFVQEVTPNPGQVTIYFMRDDDSYPIPDFAEITAVKNKVLEIKPANTSDSDVIVAGPSEVIQNFLFGSLNPNTATMKAAIEENLKQFFREQTIVGQPVTEDAYRAAIQNTIDTATGDSVTSFSLLTPPGDISVFTNQIVILGVVTWP